MNKMSFPILLVAGLLAVSTAAPAAIKCWTNNQGVRECGNVVPPEYAQQGHEEISASGISVKEVERAKTREELEAERREREAQQARERLMQKQAARDNVLLQTYTTAQEIDLALEDKIAVLNSRIGLTHSHIEKFNQNLQLLRAKAAREERGGKDVSDKVKADIALVERQIEKNEQFVKDSEVEKEELKLQYAADKERFMLLKSGAIQPGDISHLDSDENDSEAEAAAADDGR